MSVEAPGGLSYNGVETVSPDSLGVDSIRPVGQRDPSEALVKNVREVGVIEAPLVREHDGELVVLDGTRRVAAAAAADVDDLPVVIVSGDETAALAAWFTTHIPAFTKQVSDRDEERSLRELVGGPARSVRDWETAEDIEEAKYRLGLRDDTDRIKDATSPITGVGEATAERLADEFETVDGVANASPDQLTTVDGIGDELADRIRTHFEHVGVEPDHSPEGGDK